MAKGATGRNKGSAGRLKVPLSVKFATTVIALVVVLLLAAGATSLWRAFGETEQSALALDQQRADALAGRLDDLVGGLESQLAWTAQPDWKNTDIEQKRADFARILRQFPAVVELLYIDSSGLEQLKISRTAPDSIGSRISRASEARFRETVDAGTWFGPVYVRNGADLAGTAGLAHTDGGATIAELDLSFLTNPVRAAAKDGNEVFVVDATGRLIAHPQRHPVIGDNDLSALPHVKTALAVGGRGTFTDAVALDNETPSFAAYTQLPRLGWTVVVQTPEKEALAPFHQLLWQLLILLAIGTLAAAIVGIWLARRIAKPIESLRASTERLGEGDLTQRVNIRRRDEIGVLAEKFNTMASRFQQSQRGLAARADEREHGIDMALQQHMLTAGVLRAIGQPGQDLDSVLETLISAAVELGEALHGSVWLKKGRELTLAAQARYPDEWIDAAKSLTLDVAIDAATPQGLAAYLGETITVEDLPGDQRFAADSVPGYAGDRAGIAVPLKRDGIVEGVIWLSYLDASFLSDNEPILAQGFADQGVVAIENSRLSGKVDERDRTIADMRAEQKATAEVAHVAATSPEEMQPVFDSIAENAAKISGAAAAYISVFDGAALELTAQHGLNAEASASLAKLAPSDGAIAAKAFTSGELVHYSHDDAGEESCAMPGTKRAIALPLVRDGQTIGVMVVERADEGELSERRLSLLKALGDQTLVAVENVRLSGKVSARDQKIAAMRSEQAALADVSQVAASLTGDVQPAFDAIVKAAVRALGGSCAYLCLTNASALELQAYQGAVPDGGQPELTDTADSIAARAFASNELLEIAEITSWSGTSLLPDTKSAIAIPLQGHDAAIGVLVVERSEQGEIPERHAQILKALGDQALAAIENARLSDDVKQRNRKIEAMGAAQAALAGVMRVAANSPDDAGPVLDAIADAAARTLGAITYIATFDGSVLQTQTQHGLAEGAERLSISSGSLAAQAYNSGEPLEAASANEGGLFLLADTQSAFAVPLTCNGQTAGVITVERTVAGNLPERHAEWLGALADQAVEALECARLSADLDTRTSELAASRERRGFSASLVEMTAAQPFDLGALAATIAADIAASSASEVSILRRSGDIFRLLAGEQQAGNGLDDIVQRVVQDATPMQGVDGTRAVLVLPLSAGGEVVGLLTLARDGKTPFSDDEVANAADHAEIAAIAIEKSILLDEAEQRRQQIADALRKKEAAADMLGHVARSPFELPDVLQSIAATAAAECGAGKVIVLQSLENGAFHPAASHGTSDGDWSGGLDALAAKMAGVAADTNGPAQFEDIELSPAQASNPDGLYSALTVPMLRDGHFGGALLLLRQSRAAFTQGEVDLAVGLADHAAIATTKTALEQKLAITAGRLEQSLSHNRAAHDIAVQAGGSASNPQPVFDAIVTAAAHECDADATVLLRIGEGSANVLAMRGNIDPQIMDAVGRRIAASGEALHLAELSQEASLSKADIHGPAGATLAIPVVENGALAGILMLVRVSAGQFDERQVELAETLAGQARITAEGARLHFDLAERTAQFSDALDRQSAAAEIAHRARQSGAAPGFDVDGLLQGVAASARRLGGGDAAAVYLCEPDAYRLEAADGATGERLEALVDLAAAGAKLVHLPDLAGQEGFEGVPDEVQAALCVPLMHKSAITGVLVVTRGRPGAFDPRQIELLQTFADQTVVAIDNARLTAEARDLAAALSAAGEQQDAVSDIARTTGADAYDLPALLQTLATTAQRLCGARTARLYLRQKGTFPLAAALGLTGEQRAFENVNPPSADAETWLGLAVRERAALHYPDGTVIRPEAERFGEAGSALCTPLLHKGETIGLLVLVRDETAPFDATHIRLMQIFADQAVIAIENTRLLDETARRSNEITVLIEKLARARRRLSETERLAALGESTAGIMHQMRAPLNFVTAFSAQSQRMIDDIRRALELAVMDMETRGKLEDLADTISDNIKEGAEHARRADSVIRNMLEHSREGGDDHRPVDINAVVDESIGLAYHGARAERTNFDITFEKAFDPEAGAVDLYPQDITRVLLNLISNSFDATEERSAHANGSDYAPVLTASTRNLGDAVEIRIRDNGTGITETIRDQVFDPFFTTKPPGHGAGIGLSLSRDIIVKQHAGTIEIDTGEGAFTEVRIVLPRGAATVAHQEINAADIRLD